MSYGKWCAARAAGLAHRMLDVSLYIDGVCAEANACSERALMYVT